MPRREDCRLRPIGSDDLERILRWRNSERIRRYMYTDHVITMAEHLAWFERLKESRSARYLSFDLLERPVGLVYYTDIDSHNARSHWGFYLGEEGTPAGSGTAMGVLGVEYAFTELKLRKLCGEVLSFNEASIRFHRRLGFVEEGRFVRHVLKEGSYQDVLSFALFQEEWQKNRHALEAAAF